MGGGVGCYCDPVVARSEKWYHWIRIKCQLCQPALIYKGDVLLVFCVSLSLWTCAIDIFLTHFQGRKRCLLRTSSAHDMLLKQNKLKPKPQIKIK